MHQQLDDILARWMTRWIGAVDRRPGRVVLVSLILTGLLAFYAVGHLGVNSNPDAMIAKDVRFRVLHKKLEKAFHTFDDAILAVVQADGPERARRAADKLATRLRRENRLFSQVYVPGGGPFFERNGLLYLSPDQIETLTDRLAEAQPFLGTLSKDPSVVGVADLLRQALDAHRKGTDVGLDLAAALDRVRSAVDATLAGERAPDPWNDVLLGSSVPSQPKLRVVILQPNLNYQRLLSAAPAVRAIHEAARELRLDAAHGVSVQVTGEPVLNYEELLALRSQGFWIALSSLALVAAVLFFAMRSPRVILATLVTLGVSLVATAAFAAAAVGHLNQISIAFNVLIIGLGVDFGIHVCMRYAELAAAGRSRADALTETGSSVGTSLFLCAGTTAIGFYVFLPTDYKGVAELGLIAGTGMFLSLFASLTVLPALLSLGAPVFPRLSAPRPVRWNAWLRHFPVANARAVRWTAAALGVVGLALLPEVRFDYNPVNLRDPHTESVKAFEALLAQSRSSPWTIDVMEPSLARAEQVAKRLEALPTVKDADTLASYIPSDQAEKRQMLQTAAFFIPPVRAAATPPPAPAQRAALVRLDQVLAQCGTAGGAKDALAASCVRLRTPLGRFLEGPAAGPNAAAALARLDTNVLGSLPEQLHDLRRALNPNRVTRQNLPPALVEQMISPDGQARIRVYPKQDLSRNVALEKFVRTVQGVAPDATGGAVSLVEWGRITVRALREALLAAFGCMALLLWLLWRRVWDTLLALCPLVLATVLIGAAMVVLGLKFNFANVIVLPMLLGIGVDNGIHLLHRHRMNPEEVDVLATSTARAVLFSALTTIASFISLAFAPHRGMASLGQLLTLGVAIMLLCYVIVLPAILEWDDRRSRRAAERR